MTVLNKPIACVLAILLALAFLAGPEARADRLRNVKNGDEFPAFTLQTPDGKTLLSKDYRGSVLILVYLSAEQRSSELASIDATDVVRDLPQDQVKLLFATADVVYKSYFEQFREVAGIEAPLGFDPQRSLYGQMGLIVLPTTVIINRDGKLSHVISIRKRDYASTLDAYVRHTLGEINDEELTDRLARKLQLAGSAKSQASRHRAVARLLLEKGLLDSAEVELRTAMELDPEDVDLRLDLASVLLAAGRNGEARDTVTEVLARTPDDRRAKLLYGIVLFRADELVQAEKMFRELLVLNPDPARTHYYLGQICERKGDKDKALYHYRESLARFIGDEPD